MGHKKIKRYLAIATSVFLASSLNLHGLTRQDSPLGLKLTANAATRTDLGLQPGSTISLLNSDSQLIAARRSGGRSGGGSFRRSSPSSPSRPSTPSRPSYDSTPSRPYYDNGPVVVPVPVPVGPRVYTQPAPYGTQTSSSNGWIAGLIVLLVFGVILLVFIILIVVMLRRMRGQGGTKQERELLNDKVTVSKIQVALLAQARFIQTELTKLSLDVDTENQSGLLQLLQESALALLRTPENWSHVLASSQTLKSREDAEAAFNQLSVAERSKYTSETLTNVGGRVRHQDNYVPDPDKDPASYIVVTLLVGTAHDQPLFTEVRTTEALQSVLEKLAALPSDYLMVFELIWTPQDEDDSLSYDELLTEYTEMVQI